MVGGERGRGGTVVTMRWLRDVLSLVARTLLVSAPVSALNLSRPPSTVSTSREESGEKHMETAWSLESPLLAATVMSRCSTYQEIGQTSSGTAVGIATKDQFSL